MLRRGRIFLNPVQLGFKIAEAAIFNDITLAVKWVERMKKLGCKFAIDDSIDYGQGFYLGEPKYKIAFLLETIAIPSIYPA